MTTFQPRLATDSRPDFQAAVLSFVACSILVFSVLFVFLTSAMPFYWAPMVLVGASMLLFFQTSRDMGLKTPFTLVVIPLTIQYLFFPIDISLVSGPHPYLAMVSINSNSFQNACITSTVGILTLSVARFLLKSSDSSTTQKVVKTTFSDAHLNMNLGLCVVFLGIGIMILLIINPHLISATRRLNERAGQGYVNFFWFAGYFATILMAVKAFRPTVIKRSDLVLLAIVIILTAIPHVLLANRGNAFYPIFLSLITYSLLRPMRISAPLIILGICCTIVFLDTITGDLRFYFVSDGGQRVRNNYVNMNFGQLQLMAAVYSLLESSGTRHPSLILNSLLIFLPRELFPDKAYSLSPYISLTIMHDKWVDKRTFQHNSQFTTGPFLEAAYEFGRIGVIITALFASGIFAAIERRIAKPQSSPLMFAFLVFQIHLCGWMFWIADLGLFIAFQVLTIALLIVLLICQKLLMIASPVSTSHTPTHSP